MYIVLAILIFAFLIVTHELGHFLTAKAFNVRVEEFSVGMGPAICTKQKGETLYALRWIPIGGYCSMGEDDGESEDPRSFVNQVWWKRFVILFCGAAMNFLTGLVILAFIVPHSAAFSSPVITSFYEGCPYESADGFQAGDTFYSVDGHRVFFTTDISMLLSFGGETHDIVLVRDGEKQTLNDYKLVRQSYTVNGQTVQLYGFRFGVKEKGFLANVRYTWNAARDFVRMVWMGLSQLVTGQVGVRELSGPVGIVQLMNDVGTESATTADAVYSLAYLTAFIAVNLAVMNLLPLPALDGGRLFFLLITAFVAWAFNKQLDPKYEGYVHTAGFVLLLGLMAVVMYNDIAKIIAG